MATEKKTKPTLRKTRQSTVLTTSNDLIHLLSFSNTDRTLKELAGNLKREFSCAGCMIHITPQFKTNFPILPAEGIPTTFLKSFQALGKAKVQETFNTPGTRPATDCSLKIARNPKWASLNLPSLGTEIQFCFCFPVQDSREKTWAYIFLFTGRKFTPTKEQKNWLSGASRLMNILRERQRDKNTIQLTKTHLTNEVEDQTQKMREAIRQLQDEIVQRKIMERSLKTSNEKLQNLSNHLQKVREEERTRISREIHDELGQMLTTLKMKLSILEERALEEQYPIQDDILSMMTVAETTLQTVRRISTELRPGILDVLGLSEALEWQAQEFQEQTKIKIDTDITRLPETIDKEVSTAYFRICQEALTNVARHAKAHRVVVSLKHEQGILELLVRDNGKGITNEQLTRITSLGLIGMRERAQNLGGKLTVQRAETKGTEVRISFPLDLAP